MKKLCFLIGFCLLGFSGIGQPWTKKDSLKATLANARQDKDQVMTLSYLSQAYLSYKTDTALLLAQQSLDLARKISFTQGESRALFHIGHAYRSLGDIPNAMRATLQALQLAEENGYSQEVILCNYHIGVLYSGILNDPLMGLNYLKKAKQLNALENNAFGKYWDVNLDLNFGRSYLKLEQFDSAKVYFDNVLANIQNDPSILPAYFLFVGWLQRMKGNYREAQDFYSQSAAASPDSNDTPVLQYFQAICYQDMDKLDSCIYYARKSLALAEKNGLQRSIIDAASLLAGVYEAQNQYEALRYYKIARTANDKVYGVQKVQELQRIITEEMQRQQEAERQKIAYENRVRLYTLLGGLAFVLLGAFFLYRNNLQKQKTNVILEKAYTDLDAAHTHLQTTLDELKATQAQLIQSEKMASLGELTAGIAHEIQNPLNFVNNYSEVNVELFDELDEEMEKGNLPEARAIITDLRDNEAKIRHHGQRADSIVRSMMQHSRTNSGTREPTNLNTLADEYLRLAYHGLRAKDSSFQADFSTDFDETLPLVRVVRLDMGRVLLNIINNAFQACAERSRLQPDGYNPTVKIATRKLKDSIEIHIQDNGPGIPEAIKDKIFQPFFTTKPTGQGTGLGLSLAYDIVKAHGGELKINSRQNEDTEFIIIIPIK